MHAPRSSLFSTADWLRALTLRERFFLAQTRHDTETSGHHSADGKVHQWRQELSLTDDRDYESWLHQNGWDDAVLRELLVFPETASPAGFLDRPTWLTAIDEAYGSLSRPQTDPSLLADLDLPTYRRVFLTFAEPLILRAIIQLRGALGDPTVEGELPVDLGTIHELVLPSLLPRLAHRLDRALILELHLARLQGQLKGESPEDRFEAFGALLKKRHYIQHLFREYPVLARQLIECITQWVDCSIEMLFHLRNDWPEIRTHFATGADPGRLIKITGGAGDTHRNGRSVHIMSFESGLRLVYKPRPMDVDLHFHELLAWTNAQGFEPAFWIPKILCKRGYGWSEFVEGKDCDSAEAIERFYERQGGFLALLYVLEAVDFHRENLIAAGEHPVLVDLEALFHPRLTLSRAHAGPRGRVNDRLQCSVLRVGLLPRRGGGNTRLAEYEGSGLGGTENQISPYLLPRFEKVGTDQMRIVRRHVKLPARNNRPQLNGKPANAYAHREAVVRGFSKIYALLRRYRHELMHDSGPVAHFSEDEIRVVLRGTASYARVLMEASHPSLLGDAADQERLLQRLGKTAELAPYLACVLDEEIADLQSGNIPFFTSRPRARDLWTSRGARIPDFFEQSSLENVKHRIACLDESDLALQIWLIRASLATLSGHSHEGGGQIIAARTKEHDRTATSADLIGAAESVGDRLHEIALVEDGSASWLGLGNRGGDYWTLEPIGLDLFAGTAGVALFLGYLGTITGKERHTELAMTLVEDACEALAAESEINVTSIGVFTGPSGWMYTLAHLALLLGESSLLDAADQIRARVMTHVDGDNTLDVIGGSAGLTRALAAIHRCDPTKELLNDIAHCANHLVSRAERAQGGMAWRTNVPARAPLTGFSHGASGIAWALLEAAALTGHTDCADVARAAFQYERDVFLPQIDNWPDFRKPSGGTTSSVPPAMTSWCHGAPGIGLARLRALKHLDDLRLRRDVDSALSTTIARGFGTNHSICHGDVGNVQLIAEAGAILGRPDLAERAAEISGRIVAAIREGRPVCGTPAGIETPGLMVGLAGIGFGLLRLADPDRVPSVLTLDPPIAPSKTDIDTEAL